MRKIILLVAMVLMVAVSALPALADAFTQENDQYVVSGDANSSTVVQQSGTGNVQAADVDSTTNTGNVVSNTSVLQYGND